MGRYSDLRKEMNWVVIEIPEWKPYHFDTFEEALKSPIKGHLMSNKFYKQCYEK